MLAKMGENTIDDDNNNYYSNSAAKIANKCAADRTGNSAAAEEAEPLKDNDGCCHVMMIEAHQATLEKETDPIASAKFHSPLDDIRKKVATFVGKKMTSFWHQPKHRQQKHQQIKTPNVAANEHLKQQKQNVLIRFYEWTKTKAVRDEIIGILFAVTPGILTMICLFMFLAAISFFCEQQKGFCEQQKGRFIAVESNAWDQLGNNSASSPTTTTIFFDGHTAVNNGGCGADSENSFITHLRAKKAFPVLQAVRAIENAWLLIYPEKLFYYEVTVENMNSGNVSIGLSGQPDYSPVLSNSNHSQLSIGALPGSYAIDSQGNLALSGQDLSADWPANSHRFGEGDVIGCGLQITLQNNNRSNKDNSKEVHQQLFFTKNGQLLGKPIPLPVLMSTDDLQFPLYYYPTVSMAGPMTAIKANFGDDGSKKKQPFVYDIFNSFI